MIVTRFPPSPTGMLHIGSARTALFNWLYARNKGGKFVLRIEDTDRARFKPEWVQGIFDGLNWLGLNWDNENVVYQFDQKDRHAEIANILLAQGKAYYCYCSQEELEEMRAHAKAQGLPTNYDRRWRDRDPKDAPANIQPVIRIKAPLTGESVIHDEVQGTVTIDNKQLDDFILLRSDGTPTYMLSVVVDDHDMGITHIIRGDDHLNNAFRQKVIFEAMSWPVPVFAHIPLIHGPDGAKMSKRHGATGLFEYRDLGYLPEAVCNYLMRLGWSHGDAEIFSRDQAISWFGDLKDINKGASRFDFEKLNSVNAHYLHHADDARLLDLVIPFIQSKNIAVTPIGKARLLAAMNELKTRAKTILNIADDGAFFCKTIPFPYDEKAASHILSAHTLGIFESFKEHFNTLEVWQGDAIDSACRDIAAQKTSGKLGAVMMPLRAAITGTTASPHLAKAIEILGRDETLIRINAAMSYGNK